MTTKRKRKLLPKTVYHLVVLAFAILMLYPLIWMLMSSFKPTNTIMNTADQLIPTVFTLDNYITGWKGFSDTSFFYFFRNTIMVTGLATVGVLLTTPMVAYGLARLHFKVKNLLFIIVLSTMMMPEQILMIPQYLWYNKLNWINTYNPLVIPHYFAISGFFIYLLMNFINGIPKDLDEAAKIDGCSYYTIFTKIIMPLLSPAMATVAIFSFLNRWNDYMAPLLYIRRTKDYTISLALKLFCDTTSSSDYGALFAMSTLSLLPIFLIFVSMQKYLTQGVVTSGLKG